MLVLASNSPRRRELLELAGFEIDKIIAPNIDESPLKSELPLQYVKRMALAKSNVVEKQDCDFVLTADTIVFRGRRILGKPESKSVAQKYLSLLSGSRHRVVTSVCLAHNGETKVKNVVTIVKMKRLSTVEMNYYLDSEEWKGKAGAYAIQGIASVFIPSISGSYTNVVGLPLTETVNLLVGSGCIMKNKVFKNE